MAGNLILVSVDPGLDVTGVAVFEVPPRRLGWRSASAEARAACCRSVTSLRTAPATPLVGRLVQLHLAVRELLTLVRADVVLVEVTDYAGAYRERRARARGDSGNMVGRGLAANNRAVGAILPAAASTAARVITIPPKGGAKLVKRKFSERTLAAAHVPVVIRNQDEADAVFVALTADWDFCDAQTTDAPRSA